MCASCGCTPASNDNGGKEHDGDHGHEHAHGHEHEHGHEHHHAHAHPHDHGETRAARRLSIERDVLEKNARQAAENRRVLAARGVLALNLTSSPGSGKTTLLERTLQRVAPELDVAVI